VYDGKVIRIFKPKTGKETGGWTKIYDEELYEILFW
jgi:hypothetical protein